MTLFWKTLRDLKEPKILMLLMVPFVLGLLLVSLLGYGVFGVLLSSDWITQSSWVQNWQTWQAEAEHTIGAIPLLGGAILWVLGALVSVIAGVLGLIIGSYLILLFAMIITGFMTDYLVKAVQQLHYPNVEYQGHGTVMGLLWKQVKYALGIGLVFLVTLPLLFIPLFNVIWFWLLGFLFFRYALVMDVGSVVLSETQFKPFAKLTHWSTTSVLLVLFASSVLPILSFFAPVLAVIALSHAYLATLEATAVQHS